MPACHSLTVMVTLLPHNGVTYPQSVMKPHRVPLEPPGTQDQSGSRDWSFVHPQIPADLSLLLSSPFSLRSKPFTKKLFTLLRTCHTLYHLLKA